MTESSLTTGRRRLLITLLAPLVGLLLVEILVRVSGLEAVPTPIVQDRSLMPHEDPILRYVNRNGGGKRTTFREDGREWTVRLKLNHDHFRGPRVALKKPAGVLRIACLGDSHTVGDGVPEGASWPAQLRAQSGPSTEVINAGVFAYDTLQELVWYEKFVEPFDPDLVLLAYFINDVAARGVKADIETAPLVIQTHPKQTGWIRSLRDSSQAVDLLCDRIYNRLAPGARQEAWDGRYVENDRGWQQSRKALLDLRDRCRDADRDFRVLLFPYMYMRGDVFYSSEAFRTVSAFCQENDIPYFDGEPALLGEVQALGSAAGLRVSKSDFHANGRAYEVFADALVEWLRSEEVLPSASPDGESRD